MFIKYSDFLKIQRNFSCDILNYLKLKIYPDKVMLNYFVR